MRRPLLVLAAVFLIGCDPGSPAKEPEPVPPSSGLPPVTSTAQPDRASPGVDFTSPDALALAYCPYTQGPVPYWLLAEEIAPLIVAEERALLHELASEALAAIPSVHQPRLRASIDVFRHGTQCEVLASRVDGDEAAVALLQHVPVLAEPAQSLSLDGLSADEQRQRWRDAFEQSSQGHKELQFGLLLRRRDGTWRVAPQLETRFGRPLRAARTLDRAEQAVGRRGWSEARSLLEDACRVDAVADRCRQLEGQLRRGLDNWEATSELRSVVALSDAAVRARALGTQKAVTVLQVLVANGSTRALQGVWVSLPAGDSQVPLVCRLREGAEASSQPLTIEATGSATGFCILDGIPATPVTATVVDVVAANAASPTDQ